jgi:hypothetical protein
MGVSPAAYVICESNSGSDAKTLFAGIKNKVTIADKQTARKRNFFIALSFFVDLSPKTCFENRTNFTPNQYIIQYKINLDLGIGRDIMTLILI